MDDFEMHCRGEGARVHATGTAARSLAAMSWKTLDEADLAEEADVVQVSGFGA